MIFAARTKDPTDRGVVYLAGMVVGIGGNILIQSIPTAPDHVVVNLREQHLTAVGRRDNVTHESDGHGSPTMMRDEYPTFRLEQGAHEGDDPARPPVPTLHLRTRP
jgi:hypothetical protein